MKKSFLSGIVILGLLALISIYSVELFVKVTAFIAIGTVIISALFLKTLIGGKEFNVHTNPSEEREDRNVGLIVAAFGSPYLILFIIILVFSYV
ncbi:hypothetical protein [Aquibacillus rhizosphaerae]|uniref:DUF5316 domain-containing protein n=1 Tax=Aquibacillus rhizosphaerae TaxID=3051431 RepID=A0ABT7L2Y0_9BACI|nr:hypothetical protein [Aquibacillus sp. LR5S19]MDL4840221.1 hypothetical protein [Aquibacillus sp. LR5S19]